MIYYCADDYGIATRCNERMEECLHHGILNKISILPNGENSSLEGLLSKEDATLSLHINLIEGRPLSEKQAVSLLTDDNGYFKYDFGGLLLLTLSFERKRLEKQIYTELKNQLAYWRTQISDGSPIYIDSHQHVHMIPLIFKTLMRVIRDENIPIGYLRIPAEPTLPYLLTPSLYSSYTLSGMAKHLVLKLLALANGREIKKAKLPSGYFMGVMFSGRMTEDKIKKLLPSYTKLAQKHHKPIEIGLHPGYCIDGETLIPGARKGFYKFYYSPWRKKEYDTLINLK